MEQIKRYSVLIDSRLVGLFDTEKDAEEFITAHWWWSLATVFDNLTGEYKNTFVRI